MKQDLILRFVVSSLWMTSMACGAEQSSGSDYREDDLSEPASSSDAAVPRLDEPPTKADPRTGKPRPDSGKAPADMAPWPSKGPAVDDESTSCAAPGKEPGKVPWKDGGIGIGKGPGKEPDTTGELCTELKVYAKTCVDFGELKEHAEALCGQLGSRVGSLTVADDFDCKGGAREAYVSCCRRTETKPVLESGTCTVGAIGDGKTCVDLQSVKLQSLKACEAQGAALVQVVTDEAGCAGGTTRAKYACCTADAPLAVQ